MCRHGSAQPVATCRHAIKSVSLGVAQGVSDELAKIAISSRAIDSRTGSALLVTTPSMPHPSIDATLELIKAVGQSESASVAEGAPNLSREDRATAALAGHIGELAAQALRVLAHAIMQVDSPQGTPADPMYHFRSLPGYQVLATALEGQADAIVGLIDAIFQAEFKHTLLVNAKVRALMKAMHES